jgi:hypothetical protein
LNEALIKAAHFLPLGKMYLEPLKRRQGSTTVGSIVAVIALVALSLYVSSIIVSASGSASPLAKTVTKTTTVYHKTTVTTTAVSTVTTTVVSTSINNGVTGESGQIIAPGGAFDMQVFTSSVDCSVTISAQASSIGTTEFVAILVYSSGGYQVYINDFAEHANALYAGTFAGATVYFDGNTMNGVIYYSLTATCPG